MKRFAFKMFLKPGCEEEYQKRHAALWPELRQQIKDAGVGNYSIYWDKDTNILFGYQECEGEGNSQDTTDVDPITQKWWDMMADIMEVNPDNSPSPFLSRKSSIWIEKQAPPFGAFRIVATSNDVIALSKGAFSPWKMCFFSAM